MTPKRTYDIPAGGRIQIDDGLGETIPEPRATGSQPQQSSPATWWRPVIIGALVAVAASMAGWIGRTTWGGVKAAVTEGKADAEVVQQLERTVRKIDEDNGKAHDGILRRQKADGRVLRSVARKLKIDLPPEPKDEP